MNTNSNNTNAGHADKGQDKKLNLQPDFDIDEWVRKRNAEDKVEVVIDLYEIDGFLQRLEPLMNRGK